MGRPRGQEITRRERKREKSRSCVTSAAGVHRERACYLQGICQFKAKRSPQPSGALCNVDIELDELPALKDSSVPSTSIPAQTGAPHVGTTQYAEIHWSPREYLPEEFGWLRCRPERLSLRGLTDRRNITTIGLSRVRHPTRRPSTEILFCQAEESGLTPTSRQMTPQQTGEKR
jgi:hypothetical protein